MTDKPTVKELETMIDDSSCMVKMLPGGELVKVTWEDYDSLVAELDEQEYKYSRDFAKFIEAGKELYKHKVLLFQCPHRLREPNLHLTADSFPSLLKLTSFIMYPISAIFSTTFQVSGHLVDGEKSSFATKSSGGSSALVPRSKV